jgi:hypothetical protein
VEEEGREGNRRLEVDDRRRERKGERGKERERRREREGERERERGRGFELLLKSALRWTAVIILALLMHSIVA